MSDDLLTQGFSFRLSQEESYLLADLARNLGCKRGEALRFLLRQHAKPDLPRITSVATGQFAVNGHTFRLKLRAGERVQ